MNEWAWTVRTPSGVETELVNAQSRSATWRLDAPATANVSMSGRSESAKLPKAFETDLVARLNGERLYRGRFTSESDTVGVNSHTSTFGTMDYRGLLDQMATTSDVSPSFSAVDQAQIAWQLIQSYQGRDGGALGLTEGLGATSGKLRDRTYDPGAPVGKLITDLGRLIDGFEWEVDADLKLNRWFPRRGRTNVGVFDYGGLVTSVNRVMGRGSFSNAWVVTGSQETTPVAVQTADVAVDPRGRWEGFRGYSSIQEQDTLDDRAAWLLGETSSPQPETAITLRRGAWEGPDTLWLGDTFTLVVRSGRLFVETTYRVAEVTVSLGTSDADETVTIGTLPA